MDTRITPESHLHPIFVEEPDLEVVVKRGRHPRTGAEQFTARAHQRFTLVIEEQHGRTSEFMQDGDTWLVSARGAAPGGFIVFCKAIRKIADKDGVHPLIVATRRYVEEHFTVSIFKPGAEYRRRKMEGHLQKVKIEGEDVVITFEDGRVWRHQHRWFRWQHGDYGNYVGRSGETQVTFCGNRSESLLEYDLDGRVVFQ
jgi:hypothetical protein